MSPLNRLACGLLLAMNAIAAGAANLITNPDFASDLSGWTITGGGNTTWNSNSGSSTPGSIEMMASNGQVASARQCFAIAVPSGPSPNYDLIARRLITPASAGTVTEADVNIIAWDTLGCTGTPLVGAVINSPVPVSGTFNGASTVLWNELSALNTPLTVGTQSVSVTIYVSAGAGATLDYLFDDIRFGPSGTTPVRLQTFEVE